MWQRGSEGSVMSGLPLASLQVRIFEEAGLVAAIAADGERTIVQVAISVAMAARGRPESIALPNPSFIAAPLDPVE